jgi:hypothetical protein
LGQGAATNQFTTWLKIADVLLPDSLSPSYTAMIEYVPAAMFDFVIVATPATNVAAPNASVPLLWTVLNVTVPVGVSGPVDVTVAVKVTACPADDGFRLELKLVAVEY